MTEPFVSIADLTDIVGEDVSTSDRAVIALDSACELVRSFLGHHINLEAEVDVVLDGRGRYRLILPQRPVREVSAVLLDDVAVAETDYVLEREMFLRRVSVPWPVGQGNIVVTYTHGWDVSEPDSAPPDDFERVPSDIRRVALEVAKRLYVDPEVAGSAAASRDAIGGASPWTPVPTTMFMLPDEEMALKPYKDPVFA